MRMEESEESPAIPDPDGDDDEPDAVDDVHGGALPPDLVRQARAEELRYVHRRKIYGYSTRDECFRKTRRPPLKLKWIDTNKGGRARELMLIRSRLVATEIRRRGTEGHFAAAPP